MMMVADEMAVIVRVADHLGDGLHPRVAVAFLRFLADEPDQMPVMPKPLDDALDERLLLRPDPVARVPDARVGSLRFSALLAT